MAEINLNLAGTETSKADMTFDKLLDLEVVENPNNKTEVAAVKKLLSLDTLNLGNNKTVTLLDLTPNQVKDKGEVLSKIFITGDLAKQGPASVLKSVVRLNAVFEGAGISKRGGYLSTLLQNEVGPKAFEEVSNWSLRRATKIIEELPDNFYTKMPSVIANLDGEAKNLASVMFLGGFRPSDMDGLNIESINFKTGAILGAQLKGGTRNIVLSDPILDILRVQKGNRTSGPLFDNVRGAQKIINENLKIAFPDGIEVYKPNLKAYKIENITSYNFRNANESMHVELDTSRDLRRVITGRAGADQGAGYVTGRAKRIAATEAGNKIAAKVAAYTGANSVSQLLSNLGYDNVSEKTARIAVTQDLLKDPEYLAQLSKGFKESLPATGTTLSVPAVVDLNQSESVRAMGQADADAYIADKELSAAEKKQKAAEIRAQTDDMLKKPKKLSQKVLDLIARTKIGKPVAAIVGTGVGYEVFDTEAAPFDFPDALSPIGLEPSPVASELFEMEGYNPRGAEIQKGVLRGEQQQRERERKEQDARIVEAMNELGF